MYTLTDRVTVALAEDATVEGWFPVAGLSVTAQGENDQQDDNQATEHFERSHCILLVTGWFAEVKYVTKTKLQLWLVRCCVAGLES